ncbi:hypothetical protein IDJ75_11205 [Mucilaginibacter rigui]|uniref:Uncharacterized protein n=1 Tax=Mucilaginibacter rigui TaxID=534635 RepID=A0ABR7X5H8_9SPHI|nr:hypothetical protein [Mucilaginibacter rigui]MBD1385848.1 hypothetical protein [Mucilaginibacter rigui]
MEQQQLSQVELIAWRLAGKLPHIDINGTDFTIDIRLDELRETQAPWNRIDISDMETAPDSDDRLFFYHTKEHTPWELKDEITEVPEHVVLVALPPELILDPVAAARKVGFNDEEFLQEHPIRQYIKAGITPLAETFLPAFIEENIAKQQNSRSQRR